MTEWVVFNVIERADLDTIRPYYSGVDKVRDLPMGAFLARNRESGAELTGRVF